MDLNEKIENLEKRVEELAKDFDARLEVIEGKFFISPSLPPSPDYPGGPPGGPNNSIDLHQIQKDIHELKEKNRTMDSKLIKASGMFPQMEKISLEIEQIKTALNSKGIQYRGIGFGEDSGSTGTLKVGQ